MPRASDRRRIVPEARLCEICGIPRATRRRWGRAGLLEQRSGGYGEIDAVELAVLKILWSAVGPTDAPIAWAQMRNDLRMFVLANPLDVVFDLEVKRTALARTDTELAVAVRHGRPVCVLPLAQAIAEIRGAFARIAPRDRVAADFADEHATLKDREGGLGQ